MKALIIIAIVAILGLGIVGQQYYSFAGTGVDLEEDIDAQVSQNKNKYSEFSSSAVESMNVASAYKNALKDVITGALEGRYGEGGTKPLIQAVSEAYPNIPQDLFLKVQTIIESGRKDFSAEQKKLISKVQVYKVALRKPWSGMFLKMAGYPTIDLTKPEYSPIISGQTKENFATGTDSGIKFN